MRTLLTILAIAALAASIGACTSEESLTSDGEAKPKAEHDIDLIAHEWGTFTSIHLSGGEVLSGDNLSDEPPLPSFVHQHGDLNRYRTVPTKGGSGYLPGSNVTMRLETPVLYFYSPETDGSGCHGEVSVKATFSDGILNEFYPMAAVHIDQPQYSVNATLEGETPVISSSRLKGSLTWPAIQLTPAGDSRLLPATNDIRWTAPREVGSACWLQQTSPQQIPVTHDDQLPADWLKQQIEYERYIFYRGVAHKNSLLMTKHDHNAKTVTVSANSADTQWTIPEAWILMKANNGKSYYKNLGALDLAALNQNPLVIPLESASAEASDDNSAKLRQEMHDALVRAGLYPLEAEGMLTTWDSAYFKHGTRLFYIVPEGWIDQELPLEISRKAEIKRAFIGRIDLERHPFTWFDPYI